MTAHDLSNYRAPGVTLGCVQVRVALTSEVVSSLLWYLTKVYCVEGAVDLQERTLEVEVNFPWVGFTERGLEDGTGG